MSSTSGPLDSYVEVEGAEGWNAQEARVENFEDLELTDELLRGILAYGWDKPSVIQQIAIPALLTKNDVVGQAQSGTGKTGTFSIGLLSRIDPSEKRIQAVVMTPVRELAIQTRDVITALSSYMGVRVSLMVGGTPVAENVRDVQDGVQIVVATPGRFADVFGKRVSHETHLSGVRMFVVDEADEMLSAGFTEQLRVCFQMLPEDVQVCLFSATMPEEILDITTRFMRKPIRILMKREEVTLQGIKQQQVALETDAQKVDCLLDLQNTFSFGQSIIQLNSRERVERLYAALQEQEFPCVAIHGQMDFAERKALLAKFVKGEQLILLATDMLARGLDVQTVKVVINFDIPRSVDNQIHRIGRSGRFGRKGTGINMITGADVGQMKRIEEYQQTEIAELPTELNV